MPRILPFHFAIPKTCPGRETSFSTCPFWFTKTNPDFLSLYSRLPTPVESLRYRMFLICQGHSSSFSFFWANPCCRKRASKRSVKRFFIFLFLDIYADK